MTLTECAPNVELSDQRDCVRIKPIGELRLQQGGTLPAVTVAYEQWGQLNDDHSNAILLLHGFSGDSHAASHRRSDPPHPGWWEGLIGPGLALDTRRYAVFCPNVLGGCHGSTGPSSLAADGRPYGSRFPALTIRDLVAAEQQWADTLELRRWSAVIGGSLGGMRALEWAISAPERVERLLVLATTAAASPDNQACHSTQMRAIELDPAFQGGDYYGAPGGGPIQGLALARSIARLSYGCEREFSLRFQHEDAAAVQDYLRQDAERLCRRYDANSYRVLTDAMSGHNVGRHRGGIAAALARIQARTTVISIDSDRLFPPHQQLELVRHLRCAVSYTRIVSDDGHDGFLSEQSQLAPLIQQALAGVGDSDVS
jgi:homoserine O-acetyltransferase